VLIQDDDACAVVGSQPHPHDDATRPRSCLCLTMRLKMSRPCPDHVSFDHSMLMPRPCPRSCLVSTMRSSRCQFKRIRAPHGHVVFWNRTHVFSMREWHLPILHFITPHFKMFDPCPRDHVSFTPEQNTCVPSNAMNGNVPFYISSQIAIPQDLTMSMIMSRLTMR
jgi:hypothetical protein